MFTTVNEENKIEIEQTQRKTQTFPCVFPCFSSTSHMVQPSQIDARTNKNELDFRNFSFVHIFTTISFYSSIRFFRVSSLLTVKITRFENLIKMWIGKKLKFKSWKLFFNLSSYFCRFLYKLSSKLISSNVVKLNSVFFRNKDRQKGHLFKTQNLFEVKINIFFFWKIMMFFPFSIMI